VSRTVAGSLITDPTEVGERVRRLLARGTVKTVDGGSLDVEVDSICVHGDTPGAGELAKAVREALGLALR
jgi:UPF0271 protein